MDMAMTLGASTKRISMPILPSMTDWRLRRYSKKMLCRRCRFRLFNKSSKIILQMPMLSKKYSSGIAIAATMPKPSPRAMCSSNCTKSTTNGWRIGSKQWSTVARRPNSKPNPDSGSNRDHAIKMKLAVSWQSSRKSESNIKPLSSY